MTPYLKGYEIYDILCEDSGYEGFISDNFHIDKEIEYSIGKLFVFLCLLLINWVFHYEVLLDSIGFYSACLY